MKTEIIFYSQIQIKRHAKKLEKTQRCFYSILKKENWLFWHRYTVVFYDEESIKNKIKTVLTDLISNEYGIKIHNLTIKVKDHDHIHVDMTADQHALLIGKFGQNHTTIEKFLSYVISFSFFYKWKVTCKINKYVRNHHLNSNSQNVNKPQ